MTCDFEFGPEQRSPDGIRIELCVPTDLVYFEGHFDDWPVLPGVVQLGLLAVRTAQRAFPELGALVRIPRLKFQRPVGPGQTLTLELAKRSGERVDFTLSHLGHVSASGALVFESGAHALGNAP